MTVAANDISREELDRTGYIVLSDVLDVERDLRPVLDEFADVLDRLAIGLHRNGQIRDKYASLPFELRFIQVIREAGPGIAQYFDISLPSKGIRADTPIHTGEACFRVLTNPLLLDIAERIVGPEIEVSPVGHMRFKLPMGVMSNEALKPMMGRSPWHQDNGVVLPEADGSNILTVWVAINEATIENGCMQVLPGDRSDPLQEHCPSAVKGAHIPDKFIDAERVVSLPMKPGSVLLMHPRTVHGSLDNTSKEELRISMDLRYQPIGEPTGRPAFPSFVARSHADPSQELRDVAQWTRMWEQARDRLAVQEVAAFNRWDPNSALCA